MSVSIPVEILFQNWLGVERFLRGSPRISVHGFGKIITDFPDPAII